MILKISGGGNCPVAHSWLQDWLFFSTVLKNSIYRRVAYLLWRNVRSFLFCFHGFNLRRRPWPKKLERKLQCCVLVWLCALPKSCLSSTVIYIFQYAILAILFFYLKHLYLHSKRLFIVCCKRWICNKMPGIG